ncbi:hypothetical protein Ocin01_03085 [Orchesella cincta]|uniref:Uncharacterized protein n=1 Tax=Orchesella cincta TaxID=48709 RepID=A0A1D2NE97_ORCCI|nr:hypothetical protein Ocin01_03085 [Orchesella cincta]
MELFAMKVKFSRLIFTVILLSPLIYKVALAAKDKPVELCGVVNVARDPDLPACCGESVGPLGDTLKLAQDHLAANANDEKVEEALKMYFWDEVYAGHPRVFPICVTPNNSLISSTPTGPALLFKNLIEGIYKNFRAAGGQRFYKFNKAKDIVGSPGAWIQKSDDGIKLTRINAMFADMVNMRQWFHITVTSTEPLEGIMIDHIVGPLGLQLGEFSLEFNCADGETPATTLKDYGHLYYCDLRSKALAHHPNVYFGQPVGTTQTEFHVHFKYTQVSCLLTSYIQFIIIPVKKFKEDMVRGEDFQLLLSQVYSMVDKEDNSEDKAFDSKDGFPYPLYLSAWPSHYCFLSSTQEVNDKLKESLPLKQDPSTKAAADKDWAAIPWGVTDKVVRIVPNYDYEYSILQEKSEGVDPVRSECLPGPFACDQNLRDEKEEDIVKKTREWMALEIGKPICEEKCTLAGAIPPNPLDEEKLNLHNAWESAKDARIHGLVETLAYFVLIPIANLMGRFYKENPKRVCCNMQIWIFAHVALHCFAMLSAWAALGLVATGSTTNSAHPHCADPLNENSPDCAAWNARSDSHIALASIAFIAHHFFFVTGCCRSQKDWLRRIQVLIHSIGGYATYVLCPISMLAINAVCSTETIIFTVLYIFIFIITFVFLTVFECKIDILLGVSPKRLHFPILEGLIVEPERTPGPFRALQNGKKFIILGASVIMGLVWCINLASIFALKFNVEDYVRAGRTEEIPGALLGKCETIDEVFTYYPPK